MKKILTLLLAAVIFNLNAQVNFTESNLPIFVIDTYGEEIPDEDKITASLGIIYNGENQTNYLTDPFNNYNGFIGIELRGSSSQMFPKKQYGFETRDSSGEGINVSLLNFPEEEDWIINGPYSDKSLMRNALTFKLGRELGHYASRYKFVEVVLNNDYKGVYLFLEKIKRDKNRVDISKLDPDEISGTDLTGGYIIKVDKWAGEDNDGWQSDFLPFENSPNKVFYQYDYPKATDIAPEQKAYIQNYIKSFETLMDSDNYGDPLNGYNRYIDVNSFVDFFIIQEVTKNVDAYRLSSFMYKDKSDKDSLLHMGPIWDFNLAFGNADYYEAFNIDGWILEYLTSNNDFLYGDQFQVPFWWKKLFNDENFRSNVRERYINLRNNILSSANMLGFIDSVYTLLDNAQERNFERWPVLGTYVWPNYFIGNSYFAEVNYMKSWINYRLSWLDNNMFGGPVSVSDEIELKPNYFYLSQNYPNPFNPTTSIEYSIPAITNVTLRVYDILGNEIATLVNESKEPGNYKVNFDASELSSGVYFYKLQAGSFIQTKKLILVK